MDNPLLSLLYKLKANLDQRAESFGIQYLTFSIFGLLNYPIYFLIWSYSEVKQSYESPILRGTATLLCLFLLLKNYWPEKIRHWFPTYWYLTLLYCLPFFFTYMLFKNNASNVWLMSTSTILFWLVLLVDLFSYIVILMIGIAMACLLYYFTDGTIHPSHYEGYLTQYAGAFLLACICAHNKRRLENLKLQAASALGASVAHEMRSPLMILQDSFSGIKRYLPRLLNGYTLAKDAGLAVEPIRADHLKSVEAVLQDTDGEIQYANTIIDMLLVNVDQHAIKQAKLTTCSMAHCIDTAIRRYPFDPKSQVELIHLDQESGDFEFKGTEILMVHVLFNLIKNAIYFIEETKKGEIYITLEKGPKYNTLYFKDTGPGIPPHILPQLFNRFFTTTPNGTGLGLAFCKMAMEGFGGSIKCISEYGSYTQFTLAFPIMQKT